MRAARRIALRGLAGLATIAALSSCGFRPLYADRAPATAMLGRLAIAPIDGAAGFALREQLVARLGDAPDPRYQLEVQLTLAEEGVAITRENVTTRFNVVGRAAYRVMSIGGGADGKAVAQGEIDALTGYSAPASETSSAFATRAAARDAEIRLARTLADRLIMQLALGAAGWMR